MIRKILILACLLSSGVCYSETGKLNYKNVSDVELDRRYNASRDQVDGLRIDTNISREDLHGIVTCALHDGIVIDLYGVGQCERISANGLRIARKWLSDNNYR